MSLQGDFEINGIDFHYTILSIETTDDNEYTTSSDIEDHIDEADRVFYEASGAEGSETYYRWLGGPFENVDDVAEAIADEVGGYEG